MRFACVYGLALLAGVTAVALGLPWPEHMLPGALMLGAGILLGERR